VDFPETNFVSEENQKINEAPGLFFARNLAIRISYQGIENIPVPESR
jgi:hypothetical protein